MANEDQYDYPYIPHRDLVPWVKNKLTSLEFFYEDQIQCWSYFYHKMPFALSPSTTRPDAYTFDVWDEGGFGVQLPKAVGDSVASWLLNATNKADIHHICWWGKAWRATTNAWANHTTWPHQHVTHLHVGFKPRSGDSLSGIPAAPTNVRRIARSGAPLTTYP